jgi:hypothetical protein
MQKVTIFVYLLAKSQPTQMGNWVVLKQEVVELDVYWGS